MGRVLLRGPTLDVYGLAGHLWALVTGAPPLVGALTPLSVLRVAENGEVEIVALAPVVDRQQVRILHGGGREHSLEERAVRCDEEADRSRPLSCLAR